MKDRFTLKEYAEIQGVDYKTIYARYKAGSIQDNVFKEKNRIYVEVEKQDTSIESGDFNEFTASTRQINASFENTTSYRRNRVGSITNIKDKYIHIQDGVTPFINDQKSDAYIDNSDIVELCQKAYYNFSLFRNTIDLMTEFSCNKIHFRGKNKRAVSFFENWSKYINIMSFQNMFFREYFRSGNVFIYKIESKFSEKAVEELNKTFNSLLRKKSTLPSKYIILNPIDIKSKNSLTFESPIFYKRLTPYEIERIKNPISDKDKQVAQDFLRKLQPHERQMFDSQQRYSSIDIELKSEDVYAVFYKKQDYEPFAIPMGFPVLEDLNSKAELKKIDMAVARTMQQVILMVTSGETIKDKPYVNPHTLNSIKQVFKNESVGRVLVADHMTDAKFIIPDIAEILTEAKYKIINEDIKLGLNNILVGGDDKFSNQSIKIDVFLERLNEAREIFLNEFLMPEVRRICKIMNFKNVPEAEFEQFRFKNNVEYAKLYTRLGELGVLTPDEVIQAIESDKFPIKEDSRLSQQEFKELRENELYTPLVGGNKGDRTDGGDGRPTGSSGSPVKKTKTRVQTMANFGINKISNVVKDYCDFCGRVNDLFKDSINQEMRDSLTEHIAIKYPVDKWDDTLKEYIDNNMSGLYDTSINEQYSQVLDIASEHDLNDFQAAILYHSKVEDAEQNNA